MKNSRTSHIVFCKNLFTQQIQTLCRSHGNQKIKKSFPSNEKPMNFKIAILGISLFSILCENSVGEETTVILQTHLQAPYQITNSFQLGGNAMKNLECIFKELGRPYAITIAPRKRSREFIRDGKIDGFLLSLLDSNLNSFAIPTQPLVLERWNFFSMRENTDLDPISSNSIGAVLGSNESIWLGENAFEAITQTPNITSLVKILAKNRISHALADEHTFRHATENAGIPYKNFNSVFVRYVPLVTYFSKDFIAKNSDFLNRFNMAIGFCMKEYQQSNMMEKIRLSELAATIARDFSKSLDITSTSESSDNVMSSNTAKNSQDTLWKKAVQVGKTTPLIEELLKNKVSQSLQEIASSSDGKILEIFAFDKQGYIFGLNQPTSDYWQGDESAYNALFNQKAKIHYSPIEFDLSTRTFEIQVSLPIINPQTKEKIGGITIGFDADVTLSAYRL